MLTSLHLVDFKNFGNETLHMGPLTVIVGANASGKSNLRDAFRFLHGIGRGYTLSEIIGGKYGVAPTARLDRGPDRQGAGPSRNHHALPDLLAMVGDRTFENTSPVCRREGTQDAVIRRVKDLPKAAEIRRTQGLGRLHASGWMEDAIAFSEEQAAPEAGSR